MYIIFKQSIKAVNLLKHRRTVFSFSWVFIWWLFIMRLSLLQLAFPYVNIESTTIQVFIIALFASTIPLLTFKKELLEYIGLRRPISLELVMFLILAPITLFLVSLYDHTFLKYVILILPILEEWFFRGLAFSTLALANKSSLIVKLTAVIISSLMFSSAHLHYGIQQVVAAFFFGVFLALLLDYTGSIILSISFHILINAVLSYHLYGMYYEFPITFCSGVLLSISCIVTAFVSWKMAD